MADSSHVTPISATQEGLLRRLAPQTRLLVIAILIGIAAGVCAFVLKWIIGQLSVHILSSASHHRWILFIAPLGGIVATALICRYIFHADLSDGVRQIKSMLTRKDYYMGASRIPYTLTASSITLGLGGSAGAEGPMAYIGAAIANKFGRAARLTPEQLLLLLGCGAGAGIAAIFKSPLGGALFTIEVLQISLTAYGAILLFTSSITAGLTSYILGGCRPDVIITGLPSFDIGLLPALLILGIFCGIYSIYYSFFIRLTALRLSRIPSRWVRVGIAAILLSLLIALFPALYSEGYGIASGLASGSDSLVQSKSIIEFSNTPSTLIIIAILILLVKSIATSLTNNGGGVAGDFAPTIFAGAVAGYLFALAANTWFGFNLPPNQLALYGMAAVMAGAIRAPLMAMVIIVEMTGFSGHFIPIAIAAAVSYATVRAFTSDSFFSRHIFRRNRLIFNPPKDRSK